MASPTRPEPRATLETRPFPGKSSQIKRINKRVNKEILPHNFEKKKRFENPTPYLMLFSFSSAFPHCHPQRFARLPLTVNPTKVLHEPLLHQINLHPQTVKKKDHP